MTHKKYPHFIQEKAEVTDPGKTRIFGKGERREDFPAMWSASGALLLAGLPGSGRRALGELLAEKTGLPLVTIEEAASLEGTMSRGPVVAVLADSLFDDEDSVVAIRGAGKVFYLMVDARTLAQRLADRGSGDMRSVWQETAARLERIEPQIMRALHFILQAHNAPEAMVEDALEKASW